MLEEPVREITSEVNSRDQFARQQIEQQTAVDLDSFSSDQLVQLELDLKEQLQNRTEAVNSKVEELRGTRVRLQTVTPAAFGPETRRLLEMAGVNVNSQTPIKFQTMGSDHEFQLSWDTDASSIGKIAVSVNFVHGELLVVDTFSGYDGSKKGRTIIDTPMAADQGRHDGFWKSNQDVYKKALGLSDTFMEQSPFKKLDLISELTDFALKSPMRAPSNPAPAPVAGVK